MPLLAKSANLVQNVLVIGLNVVADW